MPKADVHLSWLFLAVAGSVAWPHGGLEAAGHPCGSPIRGVEEVLGPGRTLLLGEIHGTAEVPTFVGDLACRAAGSRMPLVVLLEVPSQEEPTFAHYLASDGTARDRATLLATELWRSEFPDGRSSRAMAQLLERLRGLVRGGASITVLGLMKQDSDRDGDANMADRLLVARRERPEAMFVALAGNNHARIEPWPGPEGSHAKAMGEYLKEAKLPRLVSLRMSSAPGTFWGISSGIGVHLLPGSYQGSQRFIELAAGAAPFDGWFYVGKATASPPAQAGPSP